MRTRRQFLAALRGGRVDQRTARALGITIPPSVLVRADRVIE